MGETGTFAVGVARKGTSKLPALGYDEQSWALRSDLDGVKFEKGDVMGAAFDQSVFPTTLSFYKNGAKIDDRDITGIRGEVLPAVSVADGAVLKRSSMEAKALPIRYRPASVVSLLLVHSSDTAEVGCGRRESEVKTNGICRSK